MKISTSRGALLAVTILAMPMAACGTMSTPGYDPSPMAVTGIVQNPDINGGVPTPQAVDAINRYAASCQQQLEGVVRGSWESAARGAVDYGTGGAAGGAIGSTGFAGGDAGAYAIYGGASGAINGAVNGRITGSYAASAARGECVNDFWSDVQNSNPAYAGTHPVTLFNGRSSFGDNRDQQPRQPQQPGPYRRD